MNADRILSAFLPTRAYRRANAGARCSLCGLGIVAVDFALVEVVVDGLSLTRPIHTQCTALLWDLAAELNGGDDEDEAALESAGGEDGSDG